MAQLRVTTELQDDYDVDIPFQLPIPTLPENSGHPGLAYPILAAQPDASGNPSIIYDSVFYNANLYAMSNIYWDSISESWVEEMMHGPMIMIPLSKGYLPNQIATAKNPVTGRNSYARAFVNQSGDTLSLWFLNGDAKFSNWKIVTVPVTANSARDVVLDLWFSAIGEPQVFAATSPNSYSSKAVQWSPLSAQNNGTPVPVDLPILDTSADYSSIKFGFYQDKLVKSDLSPVAGFYTTVVDALSSYDFSTPYRLTSTGGKVMVTKDYRGWYRNIDPFFFDDPSTAPLLFGAVETTASNPSVRAVFITNNSYATQPVPGNAKPIFGDVPIDAKAIWVSGLATEGDNGDKNGEMQIHAFGAFQRSDKSIEIWHTMSMDGSVTQVSDGVFDVEASTDWFPSTCITKDVLSLRQFPFYTGNSTAIVARPFALSLVDGVPTVVLTNTDRKIAIIRRVSEDGLWSTQIVEAKPTVATASSSQLLAELQPKLTPERALTAPPPAVPKHVYYLDLTAVKEDGTTLPGLNGQLGCDSRLTLQIDGQGRWVDDKNPVDFVFGSGGKIGVTIPADGSLMPSSFWVKMEGMEPDTFIDIQPGPYDIHKKFADPELATAMKHDGTLLVSKTIQEDGKLMQDVHDALVSISSLITTDPETDAPEERQHIYKSTSRNVARCRQAGSSNRRLGRVYAKPGTAFHLDFRNGFQFQHLDEKGLEEYHSRAAAGGSSFFDSVGEFFENVENGIFHAVECAIQAVGDSVQGSITFIVNGIQNTWNFVIEIASQAVELAVSVFNAISVAFEDLFNWLSYLFTWDDILATQKGLSTAWTSRTQSTLTQIETSLHKDITGAVTFLKAGVNGFFNTAKAAIGPSASIGSLMAASSASSGLLTAGATLDPQEKIDGLPSTASWLLQKLSNLTFGDDSTTTAIDGLEDAYQKVKSIMDDFISKDTSSDMDAAVAAFQTFFNNVTNRGLFDSSSLSSMLDCLEKITDVAIDIFGDIVQAIISLLMYLLKSVLGVFTQQITNPIVVGLYNVITGSNAASCSLLDLCSLVIAIPYTILYKAITNEAPYEAEATKATKVMTLSGPGKTHVTTGVLCLLETVLGTVMETLEVAADARIRSKYMQEVKAYLAWSKEIWLAPLDASTVLKEIDLPADISVSVDDMLTAIDLISIFTTLSKVGWTVFHLPNPEYVDKVSAIVQFIGGGVTIGVSAWQLAQKNGGGNYVLEGPDKVIMIGSLIGGIKDVTNIESLRKRGLNPASLIFAEVVIMIRCACGLAQGGLYIAGGSQQVAEGTAGIMDGKVKQEVHTVVMHNIEGKNQEVPIKVLVTEGEAKTVVGVA